jgi:hypothetical protein
MAIVAVDVTGPEGARRMQNQMHLQCAAGQPSAGALKRRPLDNRQAKQLLIEGERKIGDNDANVVERKLKTIEHFDDPIFGGTPGINFP